MHFIRFIKGSYIWNDNRLYFQNQTFVASYGLEHLVPISKQQRESRVRTLKPQTLSILN